MAAALLRYHHQHSSVLLSTHSIGMHGRGAGSASHALALSPQKGRQQRLGVAGAACVPQDLANAVFAVAQLGQKGTQRPHPQVS